jgi:hypothetical protein
MNEIKNTVVQNRSLKKSFFTFLICLLVGPPVAALYLMFLGFLYFLNSIFAGINSEMFEKVGLVGGSALQLLTLVMIGILSIPFSYVAGGIPAAIGGALMGAYCYFFGRPGFWVPLAILAVPCLIPFLNLLLHPDIEVSVLVTMGLMNLGLVIAAMASWFVVVKVQYSSTA